MYLQDADAFMANTRVLKQLLASNNVRSEAQRRRSRGFRNWFRTHGLRALSDDQDNSWPLATQLKVRSQGPLAPPDASAARTEDLRTCCTASHHRAIDHPTSTTFALNKSQPANYCRLHPSSRCSMHVSGPPPLCRPLCWSHARLYASLQERSAPWVQVGSILVKLVLDSLEITRPDGAAVPAFRQETQIITKQSAVTKQFRVHKQGYLVADPEVIRQLEENKEVRTTVRLSQSHVTVMGAVHCCVCCYS